MLTPSTEKFGAMVELDIVVSTVMDDMSGPFCHPNGLSLWQTSRLASTQSVPIPAGPSSTEPVAHRKKGAISRRDRQGEPVQEQLTVLETLSDAWRPHSNQDVKPANARFKVCLGRKKDPQTVHDMGTYPPGNNLSRENTLRV